MINIYNFNLNTSSNMKPKEVQSLINTVIEALQITQTEEAANNTANTIKELREELNKEF